MELRRAKTSDLGTVQSICKTVINECYGRCYPEGTIEYFLEHHNENKVRAEIDKGEVYLLYDEDRAIATISLKENEIHRFFVLPEFQNRGYGKYMMDICEEEIFKSYDEIRLDSALISFNMYRKRGYVLEELVPYTLDNGNLLCYFPMTKKRI